MNDIRSLLETLDRLDERQQWDALDAIANKYAKEGMTLDDLASMEQEARAAEPEDLSPDERRGFMGFLRSVGRGVQQAASTEDFRVKYTLAVAAEKLNLPGLYTSDGSRFCYYDSGDQGNANDAGFKSASRGNRQDAEAINAVGLLPANVAERFNLQPNAEEPAGGARATPTDSANAPGEVAAGAGAATTNSNELRLSDGSSFTRNQESITALNRKLAGMVRRLNELLAKVNESIPNSLKGYLSESDRAYIITEALSDAEMTELRQIVADLRSVLDFTDDQGSLISDANVRLLRQKLDSIPASVLAEPAAGGSDAQAAGGSDAQAAGGDEAGLAAAEPAAAAASDASGDQDASVSPGQGGTSSSLEAFARSGKGGLANDPDEVDAIKELQQYLNDLGFDTGTVDGKYGRNTINGVKAFQEYFGAATDGDAGPETIGKIIQLRSIRWGQGGSKDFAQFRQAMTRMEELIQKAGGSASTESTDMRKYLAIFERILNEALTDQEKQELQALVSELQSALDDPEWNAALPRRTAERFNKNMRDAQAALGSSSQPAAGDPAADAQADDAARQSAAGEEPDTRSAAAQAADPDGDGNADDPEAQVFAGEPRNNTPAATGPFNPQAAKEQLQDAPGMINDDEDAVEEVFRDQIKSKEDLASLVRIYPEVFEELYRFLNRREMQEYVGRHIERFGVQVPPRGTAPNPDYVSGAETAQSGAGDEASAQAAPAAPAQAGQGARTIPELSQMPTNTPEEAEAFLTALPPEVVQALPPEVRTEVEAATSGNGQQAAPAAAAPAAAAPAAAAPAQQAAGSNNVSPRPTGSGRNVRGSQLAWDRQYGRTHNQDGTPK